MTAEPDDERCPHCQSLETSKLVSRIGRFRTEDQRVDAIADELEVMGDPESRGQMREMVREMGKAMDEDLSDEMEEMFENDMEGGIEDDE